MVEQLAHVSYVLSEQEQASNKGADYGFIVRPFTNPWNLTAIGVLIVLIGIVVLAGNNITALRDRIRYFRGRVRSYQEYIPWILRCSLGVALIGAGSQHALMSPAVAGQPGLGFLQILLGFLLIAGLALTPTTLAAIALVIGATVTHPILADNLEILAGLLAIFALGQTKPGIDDLLGVPTHTLPEQMRMAVPVILRFGLGISMILMALQDKITNPHLFGAVVEKFNLSHYLPLSTGMWVASAGLLELAIGTALLFGFQTRIAAILALLLLSTSFFFFGETVYPHVSLFGTLAVLVITGGGSWSLDALYAKRKQQ